MIVGNFDHKDMVGLYRWVLICHWKCESYGKRQMIGGLGEKTSPYLFTRLDGQVETGHNHPVVQMVAQGHILKDQPPFHKGGVGDWVFPRVLLMLQVGVLENSLDRVHVVLHVGDKLDNPGEVDGHQQAVADEEAKGGWGKGVVDDMLGHEQSDGDGDEDDQGSDDVEGQSKPSTSRLIERGLLLESKDFESKIKVKPGE